MAEKPASRIWLRSMVVDPTSGHVLERFDDEPLPVGLEFRHLTSFLTQRFEGPIASPEGFPGRAFQGVGGRGAGDPILLVIPMVSDPQTRSLVPALEAVSQLKAMASSLGSPGVVDTTVLEDAPWNGPLLDPGYWRRHADQAAARAARAWLISVGLGSEIEAISRSDSSPTPTPGLQHLRTAIDRAAKAAAARADLAGRAFDNLCSLTSGISSRGVSRELTRQLRAEERDLRRHDRETNEATREAERLTRSLAQLAFGVSAFHRTGDRVERLDRAAVAVLHPPHGQGVLIAMVADGVELAATNREELVVEVAGMACRLLIDRHARVELRPPALSGGSVQMEVGDDDVLVVTVTPPATRGRRRAGSRSQPTVQRWESPVQVRNPAVFVVETLFEKLGLDRPSQLKVAVERVSPKAEVPQSPEPGWVM